MLLVMGKLLKTLVRFALLACVSLRDARSLETGLHKEKSEHSDLQCKSSPGSLCVMRLQLEAGHQDGSDRSREQKVSGSHVTVQSSTVRTLNAAGEFKVTSTRGQERALKAC